MSRRDGATKRRSNEGIFHSNAPNGRRKGTAGGATPGGQSATRAGLAGAPAPCRLGGERSGKLHSDAALTRCVPVPLRRSAAPSLRRSPAGFSIVELIVAVVIVAGIAGAVTVAVSQALRAERISDSRASAVLRADAAAGRIARDLQNALREGDLYLARILVRDKQKNGLPRDEILLFANLLELARPTSDLPEGGVYEVQYRVAEDPSLRPDRTRRDEPIQPILWRRIDPIPDDNTLGGGIVFPVVEGVQALSIQAFDGDQWLNQWDSDRDGYPHALRIEVIARSEDGRRAVSVRRVVAIDRVPPVYFRERAVGQEAER